MTKNDSNLFLRTYKTYFKKHKKPSSLAEFAKYVLKHAHQFSKITVKRAGEFILGKSKHATLGNPKQYPNQGIVSQGPTSSLGRLLQAPTPTAPLAPPPISMPREDLTLVARDYIKKEPKHVVKEAITTPEPILKTPIKMESIPVITTVKKERREPAFIFEKEGMMKKGVTLTALKDLFIKHGFPKRDANSITTKNKEEKVDEFLTFMKAKSAGGAALASAADSDSDEDAKRASTPKAITPKASTPATTGKMVISHTVQKPEQTHTPATAGKMNISETPFRSHTATTLAVRKGAELSPILEEKDDQHSGYPSFMSPNEDYVDRHRGGYGGRPPTPLELYARTPSKQGGGGDNVDDDNDDDAIVPFNPDDPRYAYLKGQGIPETPLHPNVEQKRGRRRREREMSPLDIDYGEGQLIAAIEPPVMGEIYYDLPGNIFKSGHQLVDNNDKALPLSKFTRIENVDDDDDDDDDI